jgi:hypothetical protein
MVRPPTTIHDLPDELLLNIAAQFTSLDRNRDLSQLSLVSHRWSGIAQEFLIKKPRFNLAFLIHYIWQLERRQHLLPQVRSLEIWSSSKERIQYDERGLSKKEYVPIKAPEWLQNSWEFRTQTRKILEYFRSSSPNYHQQWLDALDEDVLPGLFGLLLVILPNLTELKLGNAWLVDFPIFAEMPSADIRNLGWEPYGWRKPYLGWPLQPLRPCLKVLEVPADMSIIQFNSLASTVFSFGDFESLAELGITQRAILNGWRGSPDPREILPPSLRVLRISEATSRLIGFLKVLCLGHKGGHFPRLRRVEVYYMTSHRQPVDQTFFGVLQSIFNEAELEILVHAPAYELTTWDVGGTPWSLREKGLLEERTVRKAVEEGVFGAAWNPVPAIEAEWDRDGDAVME